MISFPESIRVRVAGRAERDLVDCLVEEQRLILRRDDTNDFGRDLDDHAWLFLRSDGFVISQRFVGVGYSAFASNFFLPQKLQKSIFVTVWKPNLALVIGHSRFNIELVVGIVGFDRLFWIARNVLLHVFILVCFEVFRKLNY